VPSANNPLANTNLNTEIFVVQNLGGRVKGSLNLLIFIETLSQGKALEQVVIIHHSSEWYAKIDYSRCTTLLT
jgi:hypothetical protein